MSTSKPAAPQGQAQANIGTIMRNNQIFIEILREDRLKADDEVLGLKLANRNAKSSIESCQAKIQELEALCAQKDKASNEHLEGSKVLRKRLEGVEWYLGKVSNQEVTSEYLVEVNQIYLAELEERRVRANKRMVEKAHTDTERRKSLEVRDENDSRNRVMQKQAELKASGSEQETSEDIKDVPSKSAEDNLSSDAKFTLTSENSKPDDKRLRGRTPVFASVDESGLLPDEDLSDPPPQIFDVDVDSVEDESEYGVDGIDSEFKINESVSHRVKKKKRR